MGGVVPGGFSAREAERLRERARALAAGALPGREAGARDLEPDLRQRPLRRDPLPRTCRRSCAELDLGERLLLETVERYGVEAVHGAMTLRRATPPPSGSSAALEAMPDGTWEGEDADRLRRGRRRRGVPRPRPGDEARRPGRGRLQRHLPPGAHLHQRDRARREDDRRDRVEVPVRPARAGSRRARCAAIDIVIPEGTIVSALPPDGAVFVYWEQSQVMISAVLRALAQGGRRRPRSPATAASADIHSAIGVRAGRLAVGLGGAVRRRDRRVRRQPPRRRRHADALVPGERDRRRGRVDRVRRARRRPPARAGAGHRRRPAPTAAARRCCATRCGSRRRSTT